MGEFNGMPYRALGGSGLQASAVGLGTWKFGYPEKGDSSRVGRDAAMAILDRAIELGVTFWDTANRYNLGSGNSERVLGEWFAAHPEQRRNVVLATKLAGEMDGKTPNHRGLSRTNVLESLYASLDRLGLDYVDLLYFHVADDAVPAEESLEAVEDLIRQDLVRYFAISNYTQTQYDALMRAAAGMSRRVRPVAVQNRYDVLCKEEASKPGMLARCRRDGVSFIAWSPLAQGLLTGRYNDPAAAGRGDRMVDEGTLSAYPPEIFEKLRALAEIARDAGMSMSRLTLSYLLTLPGMGPVIPASSTLAQLEENALAGTTVLDEETIRRIRAAVGEE